MAFQKTEIDFSLTKSLSPIVSDYLADLDYLKSFFSFYPNNAGFEKAIAQRKSFPVDRKTLVDVLKKQNQNASPESKKKIELLLKENTFTVTTGHQLNLFTGPLYFIYKILTAIKLARSLKEEFPDNNFVPVYWMASEDHDIEEINHTFIYGKKVEWKSIGKGAAGRLKCVGMKPVLEELKNILGESAEANKIIERLRKCYQEENSLSHATRILVNGLFGKFGLVILDPDDERLKKLFIPVMEDELLHQASFSKVEETIKNLEQLKYETQVHPREINLFYLTEGSRERIVKENGLYKELNTSFEWNQDALLHELNEHPDRFSPNVVLRPLYQETILPNIAYVGGPAEIAYWFEYKSMFDHHKVNFPTLALRNCVMIVEGNSLGRMHKLRISLVDIFKSADALSKEFVAGSTDSFSMEDETKKISAAFESLIQKATVVDASLKTSLEAEKQKQLNVLKSLEEKIIRVQKKKHETSIQQIVKLKEKFFPGGTLHERKENFIPYYLKYGDSFFEELLNCFTAQGKKFLILSELESENPV